MPVTFTTWRSAAYKRIKDKVKDKKELLDITDDFEVQVDGKHGPLSKYIIILTKHYIREIKNGDGKLQKEYKKHLDDKKEKKLHKEKFDDLIEEIAINQVYIELCDDLFRRISLYDPTVRPEIMHVLFKQMHASWVVHWSGNEGPKVKM